MLISSVVFKPSGIVSPHVPSAPGHPRPHFDHRICGRIVRFAAAWVGHPGEERGGAINWSPPGGKQWMDGILYWTGRWKMEMWDWIQRRCGWLFAQRGGSRSYCCGCKTQKMTLSVVMDCLQPSTKYLCCWCNWNIAGGNNWNHAGAESMSPLKQYLDNKWPGRSSQSDQQSANLHLKGNRNQPSDALLLRQSTPSKLWLGRYQATQICCFNKSHLLSRNRRATISMKPNDVIS